MSYTSILVYVDDTEQAAQRIEYAAYLAAEHGAHLTGVCVPRHAERPPGISPLVTEMFERDRAEQFERQARDVCSAFEHLAQRVGATSVESRIVHGDVVKSLTETGRYFDVVVLSRPREDAQGGELTVQETTDLMIGLGRPVLLVPPSWRHEPRGRRVLLAWSGTRESVRALGDAMPLLERAGRVDVCLVNVDQGVADHGEDIMSLLQRHGVTAVLHNEITEIDIGNALMSRASDLESDVIVMGAFGHSKLRQSLFGGVSKSMVGTSPLPVLMSH